MTIALAFLAGLVVGIAITCIAQAVLAALEHAEAEE